MIEPDRAVPPLAHDAADLERAGHASAMEELVAHIAHEVNQPLAAIAANANACQRWLHAEPANIAEAFAAAERIARDVRRASDVIGETRAFLGRDSRDTEVVDIGGLLRECVATLEPLARNAGIRVSIEIAGHIPPIRARRAALRQAVLNLVLNAIEASRARHAGLEVLVRAHVNLSADIQVSVEDEGIGFEPGSVDRLFDPLFTTKVGRMGLGLAVSRSAIESHGGRLLAQRTALEVTRFTFTLPTRES
jgi:signal transduction histidine kinase